MIHLHNLFSDTNTSGAGQSSSQSSISRSQLDNFHGELSDAVSSTLEKFGIHPNDVKISITPASTGSTVRTAPPTPGNASSKSSDSTSSTSGSTSSESSELPYGGNDPFVQAAYNNPYANTSTTSSTQSATQSSSTPLDAQQAFDQAYWASQPPAVQALQNMQNPEQRAALGAQLASEGYSIDVPIMVWGWDPSITMAMRQSEGYTWVPSALQNPVEDAPGLASFGTTTAYNANNPPAGSISV
jgi:hypothetical protein